MPLQTPSLFFGSAKGKTRKLFFSLKLLVFLPVKPLLTFPLPAATSLLAGTHLLLFSNRYPNHQHQLSPTILLEDREIHSGELLFTLLAADEYDQEDHTSGGYDNGYHIPDKIFDEIFGAPFSHARLNYTAYYTAAD